MALLDRNGVYGAPRFHMAAHGQARGRTLELRLRCAMPESGCVLCRGCHIGFRPSGAFRAAGGDAKRIPEPCRLITRYKLREAYKAEGAALLAESRNMPKGWYA